MHPWATLEAARDALAVMGTPAVSVFAGDAATVSVEDLVDMGPIPHASICISTVGRVRAAGFVIRRTGRYPHCSVELMGTTVDRCCGPLDHGVRRAGAKPAHEESTMTDQITVDFNSRDAQGFLPASLRRLATLPEVGSIISAIDREENRCLARVIAIGPASITLEPLWQTFSTPEQSRLVTNPAGTSAPRTASDGSDVPDSTVGSKMGPRG